jgi:hypothetical protein
VTSIGVLHLVLVLLAAAVKGLTLRPLIRRIPLQRKETKDETLSFSEARGAFNVAAFAALETIVDPDDGTLSHPQLV